MTRLEGRLAKTQELEEGGAGGITPKASGFAGGSVHSADGFGTKMLPSGHFGTASSSAETELT